MNTVDNILSNRTALCDFLAKLAYLGICNCSGSAFRRHPQCYFRDGILLTNEWNVHDYCSIQICTDPTTEIVKGCQNSCANGDPHPYPKTGELVKVWDAGKWVKRGCWEEKIQNLISNLIDLAEKESKEIAQALAHKQAIEQETQAAKDAALIKAWH